MGTSILTWTPQGLLWKWLAALIGCLLLVVVEPAVGVPTDLHDTDLYHEDMIESIIEICILNVFDDPYAGRSALLRSLVGSLD